ncbi:MAG TPA: DEAD/DEAH box helicase, partial [Polyangiaceae bacterium]|nr:DEAD/DEAH box helicase [Polyangiaceae bacterium]
MVSTIGRGPSATRKSDPSGAFQSFAPGSRVRARGEEWIVERCLLLPTGGYALHLEGLTELVRGHKSIFLTTLDPEIEVLRPEDTELVADDSTEYRQTRLYIETLLRRTPPTDSKLHIGHRGAIEPMDYQLVPAQRALGEPMPDGTRCVRPRILIADGTGLGKTIEAGMLLSELIKRGKGRRILVVAIKSLLAQIQRDLWARFTIPLVRLDSDGLQRVQAKIPSNRNPFSYYDRCIISVDTLKNNGRYRAELEQIRWDVIMVDECQNVANIGTDRAALAGLLASRCECLILTSATPHNGRPESFANLMRMLDPTAIADAQNFERKDIEHL